MRSTVNGIPSKHTLAGCPVSHTASAAGKTAVAKLGRAGVPIATSLASVHPLAYAVITAHSILYPDRLQMLELKE